jgi:hypothetical protein
MSYDTGPVRLVIHQTIDALASPHELAQMSGLEVQANMHPRVIRNIQNHLYVPSGKTSLYYKQERAPAS